MKKLQAGIGVLLGGILVLSVGAREVSSTRQEPAAVVGTFDSRAVLMAYVRSDEFNEYLSAQKRDIGRALERAEAAGDRELALKLADLGPAMQQRIHEQGFGTAPVDDILAGIEERFPAIAEAAGVDAIVSKWALAYQGPNARFVDVTELLAAEFQPDEATLQLMRETVTSEPVPLEQLTSEH